MTRVTNEFPVLVGDAAAQAVGAAVNIGRKLMLAGGAHQFSALLFQLLPQDEQSGFAAFGDVLLDREAGQIGVKGSLALFGGATGTAWLLAHLIDCDGPDDPLLSFDNVLLDVVKESRLDAFYDLICGWVGFGVYFLERYPNGRSTEGLATVVDKLVAASRADKIGRTWFTGPHLLYAHQREIWPEGHFDLGLAHGVCGPITLLAKATEREAHPDAAQALEQAVAWLLHNDTGEPYSYCVGDGPARVGWCYGDLGVGISLCIAADTVGHSGWKERGVAIAERTLRRLPDNDGVTDATLCHGALGNAHIYNRMFQLTGRESFLEAARTQYERGMRLWHGAEGPQAGGGNDDASLLTGSLGVALCLLALAGADSSWDRLLCLR